METLFIIVSFLFLSTSLYFWYGTKRTSHDKLSSIILLTAGSIYCLLGFLHHEDPTLDLKPWRYIDWIITVPLLIYQMFLFLKPKNQSHWMLISSVACAGLMMVFGWLGETGVGPRGMLGILSTFFGAYTFIVLANGIKDEDSKFFTFVAMVWLFYPIVYFVNQGNVLLGYAVADVLAKVGSAFYIKNREDAIEQK